METVVWPPKRDSHTAAGEVPSQTSAGQAVATFLTTYSLEICSYLGWGNASSDTHPHLHSLLQLFLERTCQSNTNTDSSNPPKGNFNLLMVNMLLDADLGSF